MNIKHMKKLVSQLERLPDEKFWMANYIVHPEDFAVAAVRREPECGTVACIAGWAALGNGGPISEGAGDVFNWAKKWLGLRMEEAENLFGGEWAPGSLRNVTRAEAIYELKRLIKRAEAVSA